MEWRGDSVKEMRASKLRLDFDERTFALRGAAQL
jgi:hypothetical protein